MKYIDQVCSELTNWKRTYSGQTSLSYVTQQEHVEVQFEFEEEIQTIWTFFYGSLLDAQVEGIDGLDRAKQCIENGIFARDSLFDIAPRIHFAQDFGFNPGFVQYVEPQNLRAYLQTVNGLVFPHQYEAKELDGC